MIQKTFEALVDTIIPRTRDLAEEYGEIQYFGALDSYTYEYINLSLNNYYIPLAKPTAEMLDMAAEQLVLTEENESLLDFSKFPGGGTFAALSKLNKIYSLMLLKPYTVEIAELPLLLQNNIEIVPSIVSDLNRLTMMGYYSEWSGYGSTRLNSPNLRTIEFMPTGWQQIGYPGPSYIYRALRKPLS